MRFYLGTHMVNWLGMLEVPLFLSFQRLRERKRALPRAKGPWALDSGGFTELSQKGNWTIPAEEYAERTVAFSEQAGNLDFAAIQDWMCEPIVRAKTGMTTEQHQQLTCLSYCELRRIAPAVPWAPVIQGWEFDDYLRHVEEWSRWQVDLRDQPIVGLGSVCRRQDTRLAEDLVRVLSRDGIKLHLFGFKMGGLGRCHEWAKSSDSLAWSFAARQRNVRLPGCSHAKCANCEKWALLWRDELLASLRKDRPMAFEFDFMADSSPVATNDRCPVCWETDLCAPSHCFWSWACPSCGHEWGDETRDESAPLRVCPWEAA